VLRVDDPDILHKLNALSPGRFPALLGFCVMRVSDGALWSRLPLREDLLGPSGTTHAATVVGIADTSCGYGARLALPGGASGFTTIELKTNFLSSARAGALACEARLVHAGRSTQVWDASVTDEQSGRALAVFRCTQAILWPGTSNAR